MLEKILLKLKAQRDALNAKKGTVSNVSDRTLEDMASDLVTVITTDEILEKADFTKSIASADGNINHYTAKQVETAKTKTLDDYKESEKVRLAAEAAEALKKKNKKDDPEKATLEETIAAAVKAAVEPIMTELNGIKTEGVTQTRSELLAVELKETPEIYRDATLKGFDRMSFKDDAEFNTYIEEIKVSAAAAIQIGKENNLNTHTPTTVVKKIDPDEVSTEMAAAIKKVTEVVKDDDKPF